MRILALLFFAYSLLDTCCPWPVSDKSSETIDEVKSGLRQFIKKEYSDAKEKAIAMEVHSEWAYRVGKVVGKLTEEYDNLKKIALQLFVVPYFCEKFDLYAENWDPDKGGEPLTKEPPKDFDPDEKTGTSLVQRDLDTQTLASYRVNARKWNRILCSSSHPLAIKFRDSLQKEFPNCSLPILAKELGLAIALLNNAKHGVIANLPEAREILQTDLAITALSRWGSLSDPVMLKIIYQFETITTNRLWKPKKPLNDEEIL